MDDFDNIAFDVYVEGAEANEPDDFDTSDQERGDEF